MDYGNAIIKDDIRNKNSQTMIRPESSFYAFQLGSEHQAILSLLVPSPFGCTTIRA